MQISLKVFPIDGLAPDNSMSEKCYGFMEIKQNILLNL